MTEYRLHSQDAEQCVIGALLQNTDAIDSIGNLKPEHFFTHAHRLIFAEIQAMASARKPIDAVTVAEELHESGHATDTGGLAYLGELVANTPSSRNVSAYAQTVVGKALERQLLEASALIKDTVEAPGSFTEKLSAAQHAVMSITEAVSRREPKTMREVLVDASMTIKQRSEGKVKALATQFVDLDALLGGGLRPGNLVIVAGRPSMGKTSLALNIGYQVSLCGKSTLVLSLEMPEQELADRLISQAGNVALQSVVSGKLEGETGHKIMSAVAKLNDLPLTIDDEGGIRLFDVVSKARSVKRRMGLDLLVIDYLQLMSGEEARENRNSQLEQVTRGLKALAKELGIPIILLSQLSRKCDERPNKRPMLSDLRDSGAIEQDADVILFVYRDEVYHSDSPDKGTAEIIIGKNRQGQIGMVRMAYQGWMTRFCDLDPQWQREERQQGYSRRRGMNDD